MALDRAAREAAWTRGAAALVGRLPVVQRGPPHAFARDGKTARGGCDGLSKAVAVLSRVAHQSGPTMAQAEVPPGGRDQTNEHKAALKLLPGLVLEGRLISGDARFRQRALSQQILAQRIRA